MSKNKVLLIGWDAADWKVISPLMDRGKMPHLERIVENGVKGNIATLHPVLSPMLWTSIATGKRPYKHGIYGFYEPTPDGLNVQPMSNLSRKTKAIWNILNQNGKKSNIVGWWPSHPAEPINGVMVSDLFSKNSIKTGKPKDAPLSSVFPEALREELGELRLGLEELGIEEVLDFIPKAKEIDQDKDNLVATCAKTLAECVTVQSVATHLMETTEWDFMAVYFDAIDHFSHAFMQYHPPRRPHINEREFELYQHVVTIGYVFHDLMLGRMLQLAGDDVTVIVMSDHGFHPDHLRPNFVPHEPAGPAIEHRDLGMFAMSGPKIAKDKLIFGSTLLDVTPTILTLFGLPVGEDMDGRVLTEAFETEPFIETVTSWDEIKGDDGCHPEGFQLNPLESDEAIKQLVELGYIDELSGDKKKNIDSAVRELNYNLARSYMDAGRYADAVEILAELYKHNQSHYRIGLQLAMCYKSLGYHDKLLALADHLATRRVNDAQNSRKQLQAFKRVARERFEEKIATGELNEDAKFIVPEHLLDSEMMDFGQHRSLSTVKTYYFDFLKGYALSAKGENDEAIVNLERAINSEPMRPTLHIQLGEIFLKLRRRDEALTSFKKALEIDDNNSIALVGIAKYYNSVKEYELACEYSLQSIGKTYMLPLAHYTLGFALMRLRRHRDALGAFEVATSQNPNFGIAYRHMAHIYWNHIKNPVKALIYRDLATKCQEVVRATQEKIGLLPTDEDLSTEIMPSMEPIADDDKVNHAKPTLRMKPKADRVKSPNEMDPKESIIVVTGLPRSGTSLMMQMLDNGGAELLVDGVREADADNPKGYLEFEKTKSLASDNSWVENAKGKVIKIVAPLLENLPAEYDYKVVFMYRNVDEVVQSQTKMLERNGQSGANLTPEKLKAVLNYQLEMAAKMLTDKGVATIRIPYRRTLDQGEEMAQAVKDFVGLDLDTEKMISAIDKDLYRNRNEEAARQPAN